MAWATFQWERLDRAVPATRLASKQGMQALPLIVPRSSTLIKRKKRGNYAKIAQKL
jgi:hypothetical protein